MSGDLRKVPLPVLKDLPRWPPGLLTWRTAALLGSNLVMLAVNGWLAHHSVQAGSGVALAINCGSAAMLVVALGLMLRGMVRMLRDWRALRRDYAALCVKLAQRFAPERDE